MNLASAEISKFKKSCHIVFLLTCYNKKNPTYDKRNIK